MLVNVKHAFILNKKRRTEDMLLFSASSYKCIHSIYFGNNLIYLL